jgi:hypothetical protein
MTADEFFSLAPTVKEHHLHLYSEIITEIEEKDFYTSLYSWDAICHEGLKEFAKRHGQHYHSITFIKDFRAPQNVRLH